MKRLTLFCSLVLLTAVAAAQTVWTPDLGNGKYKNPVLYADYSRRGCRSSTRPI